MYIPTAFREGDLEKLVGFMRANSFATLVSNLNGLLQSIDPSVHAIGVEMQRNLEGHEC
jgi:predicted FMN-binding regulatory protein PaiB